MAVFSGIVSSCNFFFTILRRSFCHCYADTQRNGGRDLCTVKISTWCHQKLWISLTSCYDMTTMNDSRPGKPWNIHTFVSLSYFVLKNSLYSLHNLFQISSVKVITLLFLAMHYTNQLLKHIIFSVLPFP